MAALAEASGAGADLAVLPELAICGYPPEDLLAKPRFARDCLATLEKVAAATGCCAAVVGLPVAGDGGRLFNAAAVCANGAIAGMATKAHLPNYGVFDEQRHFSPGAAEHLFEVAGAAVGVSICEDVWIDGGAVDRLAAGGAEVIVNLNASPYSVGKLDERLAILRRRVAGIGRPVVYVNLVGGQTNWSSTAGRWSWMPPARSSHGRRPSRSRSWLPTWRPGARARRGAGPPRPPRRRPSRTWSGST